MSTLFIRKQLIVDAPAERAFRVFTAGMGRMGQSHILILYLRGMILHCSMFVKIPLRIFGTTTWILILPY